MDLTKANAFPLIFTSLFVLMTMVGNPFNILYALSSLNTMKNKWQFTRDPAET